jgi:hypothetical protein
MNNTDADSTKERVSRITVKLETQALPLGFREFSREEYAKLFPKGTVETPLGIVKLGFH